MITNFLKICFISLFFLLHSFAHSKNNDSGNFNSENLSDYLSALISLNENKTSDALKFFDSSKDLKEFHSSYINKYLLALVLEGKVEKAINEIKSTKDKNFTNFFEADLLIALDNLKKKNFEESIFYLKKLNSYKEEGSLEYITSNILENHVRIFKGENINLNNIKNFGNLTLINRAFLSCYLEDSNTKNYFQNIINSNDGNYSRYIFFYINFLLKNNQKESLEEVLEDVDEISSGLLISQTKKWVEKKDFEKITEIFSCKNPDDLIAEFFFLISGLYSSDSNYIKSNFYLNLSYYFNPKFKFNRTILAENYFNIGDFVKTEKILKEFKDTEEIYYWYKIKKKTLIISEKESEKKSFEYISKKFNQFEYPSLKSIFDMGNLSKSYGKYDLSIKYYSDLLSKVNQNSILYSDILYRRGGSYERSGDYKKADLDLLKSLELNPDDPYVLNYLAYSWLERNYKIDKAMEMLQNAYKQKENDPYIIDSIGWAYYLIGDFNKAEELLKKAVQLMPSDPIVNDHYGDVLWQLDRKIQANYFWKYVLQLKEIEPEMKIKINQKLILGLKKFS